MSLLRRVSNFKLYGSFLSFVFYGFGKWIERKASPHNGSPSEKIPRSAENKTTENKVFTTRSHYCANFPAIGYSFLILCFTNVCILLSLASSVMYLEDKREGERGQSGISFLVACFEGICHMHILEISLLPSQVFITKQLYLHS